MNRWFAILAAAAVVVSACSTTTSPGDQAGASPSGAQWPYVSATPVPTAPPTPTPTVAPTPTPAPLAERLVDPDPAVRLAAVKELASGTDPAEIALLVTATADSDQDVALAAIEGLGTRGSPDAVTTLIALTVTAADEEDRDTIDRAVGAIIALGQIRGPAALPRLIEIAALDTAPSSITEMARTTLSVLGESDVAGVAAALKIANATVKIAAIGHLAAIGGPAAVKVVMGQVASTNAGVRDAAIGALGDMGDPVATAMLVKALANVKTVDLATSALARIHRGNASALLKYLKSSSTIRIYLPIIRIGQPGTESALVSALNKFGYKDMAVDYLNCGNPTLDKAAHTWATNHGYRVYTASGGGGAVAWGSN